jgi:hypothetical protein
MEVPVHSSIFNGEITLSRMQEFKAMPKCDVCGNDYDKTFQVTQAGMECVHEPHAFTGIAR